MQLNLPSYKPLIQGKQPHLQIFDKLRGKYVALTPEEWVRQHFVNFLINHKGYPENLLGNEVEMQVGEKRLRADSVLYGKDMKPRMILEYKAPMVAITQKVFDQVATYNFLLKVDYIVVSNGLQHFCCKVDNDNNSVTFLPDIPDYDSL